MENWWGAKTFHPVVVHYLAYMGGDEIAKASLEIGDLDVKRVDAWGFRQLMWASVNGHKGIMRQLMEKTGASLNTKDTLFGRTPLSWAELSGSEGTTNLFLEWGGSVPNREALVVEHSSPTPTNTGEKVG